MGTPHFQLPSGFAIPRHLTALIIHNAHVCEQVWPALAHPVLHLFFFVQLVLAALQSHMDRLGVCLRQPACLMVSCLPVLMAFNNKCTLT